MNMPPPYLDGARVLCWSWAGDSSYGLMGSTEIFGFAVCQYDTGQIYRFSCDRDWIVRNDWDCASAEEAMGINTPQYEMDRVTWQQYPDPAIEGDRSNYSGEKS